MHRDKWKDNALCFEYDTNIFFEKYEEEEPLRSAVDQLCSKCPVAKKCFAVGVSTKEWGVWGGIYLEAGAISKEFNSHKSKFDWGNTWKHLTTEEQSN
jgi:hypothetical protein